MNEPKIIHPFKPFLYQCSECASIKFEIRIGNGDGSERIAIFTCSKGHSVTWKWVPKDVGLVEAPEIRQEGVSVPTLRALDGEGAGESENK